MSAPEFTPEAAIIIPHYNDPVRLALCLQTLMPQIEGQRVEIIVVDNASSVDLSDVKVQFPQVRFLDQPIKGAGPARNLGVAKTDAPRLFFTDSDCVPDEHWVATALAIPADDRITGGPVGTFDETPPPRSGAEAFETVFAFPFENYVKRQGFTGTGNMVTTRAVFDATGAFAGGANEDKEWCLRAGALGYKVHWHPDLRVLHPTRNDYSGLLRKWRANTKMAYLRNGDSPMARLKWAIRAVAVAGSGILHMGKVAAHPDLSALEKWRAANTLLRLRMRRSLWMIGQVFGPAKARAEGRLYDDV